LYGAGCGENGIIVLNLIVEIFLWLLAGLTLAVIFILLEGAFSWLIKWAFKREEEAER
jgi:hypothetical protein